MKPWKSRKLFRDAIERMKKKIRSESETEIPDTVPSGADT